MTRDYIKDLTLAIYFKCGDAQNMSLEDVCGLTDLIYDDIEGYLERRMEQLGTTHEQRCVLQEIYESIGGK